MLKLKNENGVSVVTVEEGGFSKEDSIQELGRIDNPILLDISNLKCFQVPIEDLLSLRFIYDSDGRVLGAGEGFPGYLKRVAYLCKEDASVVSGEISSQKLLFSIIGRENMHFTAVPSPIVFDDRGIAMKVLEFFAKLETLSEKELLRLAKANFKEDFQKVSLLDWRLVVENENAGEHNLPGPFYQLFLPNGTLFLDLSL